MLDIKQITLALSLGLRPVWGSNANLRRWHCFDRGADLHQEASGPRHLPMSEFVLQVAKCPQFPFGLYEQILKPNNSKLL